MAVARAPEVEADLIKSENKTKQCRRWSVGSAALFLIAIVQSSGSLPSCEVPIHGQIANPVVLGEQRVPNLVGGGTFSSVSHE